MKKRIFAATFAENSIKEIKRLGVNIEFNHTCISENLDEDKVEDTVNAMMDDWKRASGDSLCQAVVHGPFTEIIPAAIDHRSVELGLERLNEAYDVCRRLNVKKMIVHSGYIGLLYHKSWHIEKSKWFWNEFMKDKPGDFEIAIENVFEEDPYLMKDLVDEIDDKRVSVCLDVGHANAMTKELSVEQWIEVLGKRITHVHFHNNMGETDEHNHIDKGSFGWKSVLEKLDNFAEDEYTITVECRDAKGNIDLLLENWKK